VLIAGTLPSVIDGSVIRVKLLLIPLGCWLALSRPSRTEKRSDYVRPIPAPVLVALAAVVVGCVGGIYGIGGGSILAPVLIGSGSKPSQVALSESWLSRSAPITCHPA
jgi:uncharacterized protein